MQSVSEVIDELIDDGIFGDRQVVLALARRLIPSVRNDVLDEVAGRFDAMTSLGDTASSFAVYVRNMKS